MPEKLQLSILSRLEQTALAQETLPDKEATLLIYCRSGRRSKDAAQKLLALGYQNVYDFGGVIDWPYELVKEG